MPYFAHEEVKGVMGSLPNLRSLGNDPNATYKFQLCEPDERPESAKCRVRPLHGVPIPALCYNSHNEIHQLKINHDFTPFLTGKNYRTSRKTSLQSKMRQHPKILFTRSSGSQCNYFLENCNNELGPDDFVPQLQLSSTSPISGRSSHSIYTTTAPNSVLFNIHQAINRRRDSLSSSGGASSVRRLIAVVRSTPSRFGPIYSRRVLCRNFAALCLGHATITAALFPLLPLQSSISLWWWPLSSNQQKFDPGSLLLSSSFAVASVFSFFTPCIIRILGCNWTLVLGYVFVSAFFMVHLYPTIRWLIPAYLLLGVCLGPIACAKISYLVTLANKLTYVMTEEEEEYDQVTGDAKDNIVQKLSRGLQASQDFGMVVGNAVVWFFLHYSKNLRQEKDILNEFFDEDESGDRICGSLSCPSWEGHNEIFLNTTWNGDLHVVSCRNTALLASVFVGCAVVAIGLTAAFTDKTRLFIYQDPLEGPFGTTVFQSVKFAFKDSRLQLAAPLSLFIGLQQGFLFSDYTKWYVVCSLGIPNISLVFLGMGLLQSIAAFTLSLLMQNVPRYLVIGFIFHSCLLLVLLLWKPSGDDSALFYVIAAAWGVCNIIWETLNFSFLMHIYPDSTKQIAFVHNNFFRFLGISLAFGLHGVVCTWVKLYGLAFAMILGITPHIWLEIKLNSKSKSKFGLTKL